MSFSSNSTSYLGSKVEGKVLGSSPTMCKLPIKKEKKKRKKVANHVVGFHR
jgi:hypothetical protein